MIAAILIKGSFMEKQNKMQLMNAPTTIKPMFADEVMVGYFIKGAKDKDGNVIKEGHVRLNFIDMIRKQSLAEVILTPLTAKALLKILSDNLKKLDEQLKSKEMPKKTEILTTSEDDKLDYIG